MKIKQKTKSKLQQIYEIITAGAGMILLVFGLFATITYIVSLFVS